MGVRAHAKAARRATNPKSKFGKLLRGCVVRCSSNNISVREQIIGQGQVQATALPVTGVSTNTHYTINLTECLFRQVNAVCSQDISAAAFINVGGPPRAFVHNMMVKLHIWNTPTGASTAYISSLKGRVFTYYLANTNQDYSLKDNKGNYRSQWGTKDPVTGNVASPGISLIYNGNQLGASAAYAGDWLYLSEAPFNKDVIKFVKVKKFHFKPTGLGTASSAGNQAKTIVFNWELERMCKVENQLTFDTVPLKTATDQLDPDIGLQLLLDQSASGQQGHSYTKYMTVVVDDMSIAWTAGVPTASGVCQMTAEYLINLRPIV